MAHERAIGTLHSIRRVNPVLVGVSLSCLFLAGAWLASFRSAVELRELVDSNIRLNLQRTAATASSLVNPNLHSKIRKPEDLSSSEYEVISEKLAELQKRRPDIAFVYTVIAREDDVHIVVDPTPPGDRDKDGVEDKSYVMDLYPEASDELRRALRTGQPAIESEPQTDRWGTFVSAYSPVFKEDGTLECVVGVDLRYESYLANLAQVQSSYRQWITVAFLISLIIGAVGTGGARRLRQVIALTIDQQETLNERNSQLAQMSDELFEQAHTDPLTGLDNRMAFEKFASASLQQLREQDEAIILLADIDHFKNINDTCGHEAGDSLIIECANRMRRYGKYDALARFGGDEFVAVFVGAGARDRAEAFATFLAKGFNRRLARHADRYPITMSVGLASSITGGTDLSDLVRQADVAMYSVKGANRADFILFDESMDQALANRLELEGNLRDGLDRGEFWLAIQPVVDLRTGIPLGGEGLARWTRPDGTDIPPSTFIPIAESCGLIHRLGMTALHEVCRALDELNRDNRTSSLRLSVNVSGIQLADPTFADQVIEVIQGYDFDPHNLTLEITESVFMANLDGILNQLHKLRKHGIAIALDDFGTGYSSLSMLVNLPLDTVKIDKSFVAEMCNSSRSYTLIKSMITLTKSLNLKLVAEGVEHSEQAEELQALNCPYVQGFHFARPMDLASFKKWSTDSLHWAA